MVKSYASTASSSCIERAGTRTPRTGHDAAGRGRVRRRPRRCRRRRTTRRRRRRIPTRSLSIDAGRGRRAGRLVRVRGHAPGRDLRAHPDERTRDAAALARALRPRDRPRRRGRRHPGDLRRVTRRRRRSPSRTSTSVRGTRPADRPARRVSVRRGAAATGDLRRRRIPAAPRRRSSTSVRAARASPGPGNLRGMAQTFTRMDESTAEQWAVIGRETIEHQSRVADRALDMLRSLAEITDGFAVDQLTHSLQTATRAERAGADPEMVFASLLHDIGKAVSVPNHPGDRGRDHQAVRAARGVRRRSAPTRTSRAGTTTRTSAAIPTPATSTRASRGSTSRRSSPTSGIRSAFDPDYDTLPARALRAARARDVRDRAARRPVADRRQRRSSAARRQGRDRLGRRPGPRAGERARARPRGRHGRARGAQRRLPGAGRSRRSKRTAVARSRSRPTSSTATQVAALVDAHGRRVRSARRPRQQRVPHGSRRAVRCRRPRRTGARSTTSTCGARSGSRRRASRTCATRPPNAVTRRSCSSSRCRCARSARTRARTPTSKAALRTAVQALALELGPARVRVNARRARVDRRPERRDVHRVGVREPCGSTPRRSCASEIEARIPLGLIPPQDEIAHSVVFFASPWSKVVTGQTLDVNGGEWFA